MFKNLSVWKWNQSPELLQAIADTQLIQYVMSAPNQMMALIEKNPPVYPAPGRMSSSGLKPIDDVVYESCTELPSFMPLTQVIRERVVDKGAVDFELKNRVKTIEMMDSRLVSRKERADIKDQIINEMMDDAPVREKFVTGIWCNGFVLVDAVGKRAQDYIAYTKSLFNQGYISIYPADISEYVEDEIEQDRDYLTDFARDLILTDRDEDSTFEFAGGFCFEGVKEKLTVEDASETTIMKVSDRINHYDLKWISIEHEHADFKLSHDLTLKSIKLKDLDYVPGEDEGSGLTAAYYRFYISFFSELFNKLACQAANLSIVNEDDTEN